MLDLGFFVRGFCKSGPWCFFFRDLAQPGLTETCVTEYFMCLLVIANGCIQQIAGMQRSDVHLSHDCKKLHARKNQLSVCRTWLMSHGSTTAAADTVSLRRENPVLLAWLVRQGVAAAAGKTQHKTCICSQRQCSSLSQDQPTETCVWVVSSSVINCLEKTSPKYKQPTTCQVGR